MTVIERAPLIEGDQLAALMLAATLDIEAVLRDKARLTPAATG
ncbi:MAG: hypothetical protein OXB92_05740 [Acidimicrobiaceae bacterium]|nr:hypothetical protein [Acidimicrobiaceae bacterium]